MEFNHQSMGEGGLNCFKDRFRSNPYSETHLRRFKSSNVTPVSIAKSVTQNEHFTDAV